MNIAVFGLGYVGVVTSACFARQGHRVFGVDVSEEKVRQVREGRAPIVEDKIGDLVREEVESGRLRATTDAGEGLADADLAIICVGTPSRPNGSLNQAYIEAVTREIGALLRNRAKPLALVYRSTMVPGTMRGRVLPLLKKESGRPAGDGYDVVFHPEFLREGTSVDDFYGPPKIVVGERAPGSGDTLLSLYDEGFACPRIRCSIETAETVKYCDNLFHALKITFANEIGQFCHAAGIDAAEAMEIFCQDTKLNISPKYLRPGFAFGGSCLPKDLRAFLAAARERDVATPMLEHVLPSNVGQIDRAFRMLLQCPGKRIGFVGLSFKEGTDDLRESPYVELAERLIGKGRSVACYDPNVKMARLVGGNRSYVEQVFPHLAETLVDGPEDLDDRDVYVLAHGIAKEKVLAWLDAGATVLDLTGRGDLPFGDRCLKIV